MEIDALTECLDDPGAAAAYLGPLGVKNVQRGHANLVGMAQSGITTDLLATICDQLAELLPASSDADMALNNLDRFVAASRNALSLGALFERDPRSLAILMQIFASSQHLSDLLISDTGGFDLLRMADQKPPPSRADLVGQICGEVAALDDEPSVMAALRWFKRRGTLRIAYDDIVHSEQLDPITAQISFLADALIEAALATARRRFSQRSGIPRRADGSPAQFVVLALGKLGGVELNYSSDIDLMFLYDEDGKTDGVKGMDNREYFDRAARDMIRLLTEPTELGVPYRIDLRLRPEGERGPMIVSLDSALHYYDVLGRTWERQAFVKARPVAGDLDLGRRFLQRLEPWIYRRYLGLADITGIKALKRRIEQRARGEHGDGQNVKTGHGGIRDIEFVIQFLQLLHGGDLPDVRTGNTLAAIAALERVGCLTMPESTILEKNYTFLRKIEHRLQIMFDLQTHTLPGNDEEMRKLALRTGYADTADQSALEAFKADYESRTEVNHGILRHLLHDAFGDDAQTEPEIDLVLDPEPSEASIRQVLARHGFRNIPQAYENLMDLTTERVRFLSTRRCRHFLASIAPRLLAAIAATPDPDFTLTNLSKVSDSLGGKGVLWELFSFNPATLHLYVRLCASSPYLSGILTSNPGMIDELMDSLVLDKLSSFQSLDALLADLCRNAEDVDPILHSFKNSLHLRVGVRDILGKEDVAATHRTLSDVAEVCLKHITLREYDRLVARFGEPTIAEGLQAGKPCELIILALGKAGGREPNYHSDLDIVFLYEADGVTEPRSSTRRDQSTSNQHFFSQLGQRIIKVVTYQGPYGRLYELDPRLRPTGKSGALAVSLTELARYHEEGRAQLWERQAMCKARPVFGSEEAGQRAMRIVHDAIVKPAWQKENANQIRHMRRRLEETASKDNLKRGPGGTVDVEFLVQMLQIANAAQSPSILVPGTLEAIRALREAGHLHEDDAHFLSDGYRFLRSVEARLRLMNTTARHDLPTDEHELARLAYLLDYSTPQQLLADCRRYTTEIRRLFNRLFDSAAR